MRNRIVSAALTAAAILVSVAPRVGAQAMPAGVTERSITVPGPVPLPGTLTLPAGKGPFPGVILVHGSGAGDRDETMPPPSAPSKPFQDLAWGLAQQGIVVLRYDKRFRVKLPEASSNFTVREEVIDDALSALVLLRQQPEVDVRRTFQLGHSLGGMLAPRIGKADGKVAGLIIIAGATRVSLIDQITRQYNDQFAAARPANAADSAKLSEMRTQLDAIFSRPRTLKPADSADNTPLPGLGGTGTRYWLDLGGYDPAATMRDLPLPALVLQGMRDYQVLPDQLDDWLRVVGPRTNITVKRYPSLNHLFMSGTGTPSPADYNTLGHVDPQVIADIVAWVRQH